MITPVASVRIRPMVAADLNRVLEIGHSLENAPHWGRAAYLEALDSLFCPRRIALVAENAKSGTVAGFAVASLVAPQSELELIAVAAPSQRQGVARLLFASLAERLQSAQIAEIFLEARSSNLPALQLYRSLGFEPAGRRLRYYSDPVEDAEVMRLFLK